MHQMEAGRHDGGLKALWADSDLTSLASGVFCVFAGIYFNYILTCVVLVCCICDKKGEDQRSVRCTEK